MRCLLIACLGAALLCACAEPPPDEQNMVAGHADEPIDPVKLYSEAKAKGKIFRFTNGKHGEGKARLALNGPDETWEYDYAAEDVDPTKFSLSKAYRRLRGTGPFAVAAFGKDKHGVCDTAKRRANDKLSAGFKLAERLCKYDGGTLKRVGQVVAAPSENDCGKGEKPDEVRHWLYAAARCE
jgi:hypothetical protein